VQSTNRLDRLWSDLVLERSQVIEGRERQRLRGRMIGFLDGLDQLDRRRRLTPVDEERKGDVLIEVLLPLGRHACISRSDGLEDRLVVAIAALERCQHVRTDRRRGLVLESVPQCRQRLEQLV